MVGGSPATGPEDSVELAIAAEPQAAPSDAQLELVGSLSEARAAATRIAQLSQRLLTIHTHDLEPAIFECAPFLNAVKRLVLGRRFAKVRVLIVDPARIHYEHNPFIVLARKLTSYIEIRHAAADFRGDPSSYMVADDHAFLCRLQESRWEGISHIRAPLAARAFLDRFDLAWTGSGPDRSRS